MFSATRGLVEHAEDPSIEAAVAAAKLAVANCAGPVVLADHSERSGYATWLLRAVIEQGLARALIGTAGDAKLVANLIANGAKVGDAVDLEVGGLVDESVFAGAASGPDCRSQPGTSAREGSHVVPYWTTSGRVLFSHLPPRVHATVRRDTT